MPSKELDTVKVLNTCLLMSRILTETLPLLDEETGWGVKWFSSKQLLT